MSSYHSQLYSEDSLFLKKQPECRSNKAHFDDNVKNNKNMSHKICSKKNKASTQLEWTRFVQPCFKSQDSDGKLDKYFKKK